MEYGGKGIKTLPGRDGINQPLAEQGQRSSRRLPEGGIDQTRRRAA